MKECSLCTLWKNEVWVSGEEFCLGYLMWNYNWILLKRMLFKVPVIESSLEFSVKNFW